MWSYIFVFCKDLSLGTSYFALSVQHSGFPGGSNGKESTCSVGDLSLIPGSGKSPEERNGYPLQYFCLENSWTEEPCWLQSMGSQRVRCNWATDTHFSLSYKIVLIPADSLFVVTGCRQVPSHPFLPPPYNHQQKGNKLQILTPHKIHVLLKM